MSPTEEAAVKFREEATGWDVKQTIDNAIATRNPDDTRSKQRQLPEVPVPLKKFFGPRHDEVLMAGEIVPTKIHEFTADEALFNLLDVTAVHADLWAHVTTLKKWKAVLSEHAAWQEAAAETADKAAAEEGKHADGPAAIASLQGKPGALVLDKLWDNMMACCRDLATFLDAYTRVRLGTAPEPGPNTVEALLAMVPERARGSVHVESARAYIREHHNSICSSQAHSTTAMYILGMAVASESARDFRTLVPSPIYETPEGIYGKERLNLHEHALHTTKTYKELDLEVEETIRVNVEAENKRSGASGNPGTHPTSPKIALAHLVSMAHQEDLVKMQNDTIWCHTWRRDLCHFCCNHRIFVPRYLFLRMGFATNAESVGAGASEARRYIEAYWRTYHGAKQQTTYNHDVHGPLVSGERPSAGVVVMPITELHQFMEFCVLKKGHDSYSHCRLYLAARERSRDALENDNPMARINLADSDAEATKHSLKKAVKSIHAITDVTLGGIEATERNLKIHNAAGLEFARAVRQGPAGIKRLTTKYGKKAQKVGAKQKYLEILVSLGVELTGEEALEWRPTETREILDIPPVPQPEDVNKKDADYKQLTSMATGLQHTDGHAALLKALLDKKCPYSKLTNNQQASICLTRRRWAEDSKQSEAAQKQQAIATAYFEQMPDAAKAFVKAIQEVTTKHWGYPADSNAVWGLLYEDCKAQIMHKDLLEEGVANVIYHLTAGLKTQMQPDRNNWRTTKLSVAGAKPGDIYSFRANHPHRGPPHKGKEPRVVIFMPYGNACTDGPNIFQPPKPKAAKVPKGRKRKPPPAEVPQPKAAKVPKGPKAKNK